MKYLNNCNVPDYLFDILSKDYEPKEKRIGVTTLIDEPLPHNLKIKYWDKLEIDVMDKIFTLKGRAWDLLIQQSLKDNPRYIVQDKMELKIDGWEIVGKPDIYDIQEKAIIDNKVTSVWKYIYREKWYDYIEDFIKQVNCYAYFHRLKGNEVNKGYLDFKFDDWKRTQIFKKGYPKTPILRWDVKIWPIEEQEAYIKEQLHYFTQAPMNECSDKNKWKQPDQYAIMKKGRKSAVRVFDTMEECHSYLIEEGVDCNNKDYSIVKREGGFRKCEEGYCDVSSVCPYYKKEK